MGINREFIQMPLNEFCECFTIGKCHPRKYLFVSFPIIARHWEGVHVVSAPRPVLPFFFKNEEIIPLGICYRKLSERLLRFNNFHLDFSMHPEGGLNLPEVGPDRCGSPSQVNTDCFRISLTGCEEREPQNVRNPYDLTMILRQNTAGPLLWSRSKFSGVP